MPAAARIGAVISRTHVDRGSAAEDASTEFRLLFDALDDAALLVDPAAGRICEANAAAARLLCYDVGELCRMGPADLHPHETAALEAFFRRAIDEGRWWSRSLSCQAGSGQVIPVHVRASGLTLNGRELLLLLVHDLRTDELVQIGQSLRRLMHDLRNTLATSQLISDRLKGHADNSVARGAEVINRSIERAVRMSEDILRDRKLGASAPRRERFVLADVTDEVADALTEIGDSGAARFEVVCGELILDADFDQTFRIVLNLCRNALDAGARKVAVVGHPDPAMPAFDVVDDGPGLPDSVRTRLFEAGEPGLAIGGSGLGLLIVRELARAHGGDLALIKTGPEGVTFRVTLPVERIA